MANYNQGKWTGGDERTWPSIATTHDLLRPARKGAGNNKQTTSNLGTTDTTITNTTQAEAHGPVPSSLQQAAGKTISDGTTHGTMVRHGIGTSPIGKNRTTGITGTNNRKMTTHSKNRRRHQRKKESMERTKKITRLR